MQFLRPLGRRSTIRGAHLVVVVVLCVVVAVLDGLVLRGARTRLRMGETFGDGARRYRLSRMVGPSGRIPPGAYLRAKAHIDRMRMADAAAPPAAATTSTTAPIARASWRWLGPSNM